VGKRPFSDAVDNRFWHERRECSARQCTVAPPLGKNCDIQAKGQLYQRLRKQGMDDGDSGAAP
jgi:hypothetical protein